MDADNGTRILVTMSVGEYAGVPLQEAGDTWRNGAVFLLRKPASADAVVLLDDWVTTVVGGAKAVITCGPSTVTTAAESLAASLEAANVGLDYMSATGQTNSAIVDVADDNIVWWSDPTSGHVIVRATTMFTFGFDMNATGVVTDAAGNLVAPPPVAPLVHDAFRFIRMCKTSGDLFDAYRNLFLAFECLLSDIRPRQRAANGRWESEKRWFMDALTAADQLAAVADLAPPGEPNPKDWVYQNIYSAERSALMHAKLGERYLLPHDATSRVQLTRSLENLWRYVKEVVAKHLGVTSGSAHLATAGWAMMADPTLREMVLFVSDDASPPNPNAANPEISEESTTVELQPGEPHGDPSEPLLRTILASIDPAELSQLDGIRKSGVKEKATSSALVCSELNGPLRLGDSVARFEVLHGVRSVSVKGAPRHFSS